MTIRNLNTDYDIVRSFVRIIYIAGYMPIRLPNGSAFLCHILEDVMITAALYGNAVLRGFENCNLGTGEGEIR